MPPTPEPICYRELCNDPDRNPLGATMSVHKNQLRQIYSSWSAGGTHALGADDLREQLLMDMDEGMIGGILTFVETDPPLPGGMARVIHNVKVHTARSSAHRGTTFAYVGDVTGQDIELIGFDNDLLAVTSPTRVYKTVDLQKEFFANSSEVVRLAGAHDPNDADTHEVTTRGAMFLPYPLVPYVINDPNQDSRDVFESLIAAMEALNLTDVCRPLVEYLLVATTRVADAITGIDEHSEAIHSDIGTYVPGCMEVAHARRGTVLHRQLPALKPRTRDQNTALTGILGAMKDVRNGLIEDLADRRLDRDAKKTRPTVETRWPEKTVDRLCKLCGVRDWQDLPTLYHEMAAHKKTDGTLRSVFQEAVETAAAILGNLHCPTVTVQHATALTGWVFFGAGDQALGEGLMPFSITPPNQVSAGAIAAIQATHEQNMDHHTVMTGSTSVTAADAQKMRSSKGYIPANFEEMLVQLSAYTCILGALLGTGHANVIAHRDAVQKLVVNQALLKQFVTAQLGPRLGAATLVYYFQLRHRNWFRDQWKLNTVGTMPAPRLSEGIDTFANTYTTNWLPNTSHVDVLAKLTRPAVTPESSPGRGSSGGSDGSSPSTGASGSTGGSTPSRPRARNNNRDPRVMGETPLARRIRQKPVSEVLAAMGGPPACAHGGTRCLSWHLKGKCFEDCTRADDHIVLSSEEADKLVEWCERAYP